MVVQWQIEVLRKREIRVAGHLFREKDLDWNGRLAW